MRGLLTVTALALALSTTSPASATSAEARAVPLASAPGVVGKIGKTIIAALRRRYGVDARRVPTVVLDAPGFRAAYQRATGRSAERIMGFELRGVVYVKNHILNVNITTVAHEVLHALSQRFAREARARGYRNVIEGVTDYLTHKVIPRRSIGRAGFPRSAYGGYEAFAARLAEAVGDDVLAECYFERGFDALERAVDARAGVGFTRRGAEAIERR